MVKENFKVPGLYPKQPVSGHIGIRRGATQRSATEAMCMVMQRPANHTFGSQMKMPKFGGITANQAGGRE